MQHTIIPASVTGSITAPASKSVMQRACAAALLRRGTTIIHNYGRSEDDSAALELIQTLGATVAYTDDHTLRIFSEGKVNPKSDAVLHCGESGLSLRMFTPIAALSAQPLTITGRGSLLERPVDFFGSILPQCGVKATLKEGRLPLQLQGPLMPADIRIDGALTSQFLTGLLMAYAVSVRAETSIVVDDLKSKPYTDLTLNVMEAFGMPVPVHEDYKVFRFKPGMPESGASLSFTVEADWSNAAFLLVAGAIAGNLTVKGLDVFSSQADKKVLEALQDCGCRLSIQSDQIEVSHQPLKAFHFDATSCPDLFPPLVALAACCEGTSVIEGVHRLTHKESNRSLSLQEEFGKMGIAVTLQDDKMIIKGAPLRGATVHSHHDHRVAMACAVAALRADGPVIVAEASAVRKSYPGFWNDLAGISPEAQRLQFPSSL